MKNTVFLILFLFGIQSLFSQNENTYMDIYPDIIEVNSLGDMLSPWETFYIYPMPDPPPTSTAAESDGEYLYVTGWMQTEIRKYDMLGNLVEAFTIPEADGVRDLCYDGEYYYAGMANDNGVLIMDLDNQVSVGTISTNFACRAIAYNDDLDVFYGNNWGGELKTFTEDGTVINSVPINVQTHTYASYYGLAYDNWSQGGPYLWAFSQEGVNSSTLIQLSLPDCQETGVFMDLAYLNGGASALSGGLFIYPDYDSNIVVLGGMMQNDNLFGLELADLSPPQEVHYAVTNQHTALIDSFDIQITWSPARHYLVNEYFDGYTCPPFGWEETNNGGAGWNGIIPHYMFWPVADLDSRYAVAYEDIWSGDRCCDYLISPEFELDDQYDYFLSFESYYDGSNNHSAFVKYSIDDGQNWELLHSMLPDSGHWVDIRLDLSSIPDNQTVKIAFHSDDNGGFGSGWAINNVIVYTDDLPANVIGYNVYRDTIKLNSTPITDTSIIDQGVMSGDHEYYVEALYAEGSIASGKVNIFVPYYPPPPPTPDCNPPANLQANVILPVDNGDIFLNWEAPEMTITSGDGWEVQFVYPLAGDEEAGFTCDGNHFYTSFLKDHYYGQYDLQGNYLNAISVFEYSARNLEYVPLTGYTYVSYERFLTTEIIELPSGTWMGNFNSPGNELAMAYNPDLDAFYINDGTVYIKLVDRETGDLISSMPCGPHGNYYDLAYDNVSPGGPFLWGFSADGPGGCTLVQMSLPDYVETGFTYDASWLSTSGDPRPGGLFITADLVPGTASLCGIIKGEIMFGLELGSAEWDFYLGGYNIYWDGSLHNAQLIDDTTYLVSNPSPGTYQFEVTAVYVDSTGNFICESPLEGPASVTINGTDVFLIGGNIIAGAYKLDRGNVSIYRMEGGMALYHETTEVDDLGYFLFPGMVPGQYMLQALPAASSEFFATHIPTYNGDIMHWEDASATYLDANSYNNDIYLIELQDVDTGIGLISGVVYEDGTNSETPLSDVLVMLLDVNGACILIDYTDQNGEYSFENLPFGTYYILVEILGKSMNPSVIYLQESIPERTNMDLYVLSDEIVFGIEEDLPEWVNFISEVYPNPVKEAAYINISLEKAASLLMRIVSITGEVIQLHHENLNKGSNSIKLDLTSQTNGIYFLSIEFSNGYTIQKKLLLIR